MKFFLFLIILIFCQSCEKDQLFKQCPIDRLCKVNVGKEPIQIKENELVLPECIGMIKCSYILETKIVQVSCESDYQIQPEICDGLDNDCDGQRDNDPSFDQDQDGFRICEGDCDDKNENTNPGIQEVCDRIDNDCDGTVDEISHRCWNGPVEAVFTENSVCQWGTNICHNGVWDSCLNQILPQLEICDGLDNDCDGKTDEDEPGCGPSNDIGACEFGTRFCLPSGESFCENATYPQNEECNNADDDCDGQTDEQLERICQTICGIGKETCSAGVWECQAPTPQLEICDGLDNDCNGTVDDDCPCSPGQVRACIENIKISPTETATCGLGVQICEITNKWGDCFFVGTTAEQCNAWDDDCDGIVDQLSLQCGDFVHAGIGECRLGEKECVLGNWTECVGDVAPQLEICDQKDNDCNELIDDGLVPHTKVDFMFIFDGSGSMCDEKDAIISALSVFVQDFEMTEHQFGFVIFPGITYPTEPVILMQNLTNISSFIAALAAFDCDSGGSEPSYDAMEQVLLPTNPLQISWRSDAYPYVLLITDEPAQSWIVGTPLQTREIEVSGYTLFCQISGCVFGDRVEVFIMTLTLFFYQWDLIVFGETDRLIDIAPVNEQRYIEEFRKILKNACF